MNYELVFEKNAEKFINKHKIEADKFINAFKDIVNNYPEALQKYDIKKLAGMVDIYRLRIGKYRAVYTIKHNQLIILVLKIGSRGDIYK